MANSEIESYLRSRLQDFLPSTDVSAGSQADRYVVQPLLTKIGPDPLSTDVRSFILAHLAAEYPDIDATTAGSQIDDLILGPLQLLFEPFRREIAYTKASQSLANPTLLSGEEVDSLLANVFANRQEGGRSSGTARVYFADKRTIAVDGTTSVLAAGGLKFYCLDAFVLTSDTMALQVEDGLFYVDFDVEAELEGSNYDIPKETLSSVSGLPGVVKVVNKSAFAGGAPVETPQEASDRALTAIGERSPNTENGIYNRLLQYFPSIRAIKTIGYGDPEMVRDIIRGTATLDETLLGLGPVVMTGSAGAAVAVDLTSTDYNSTGPVLAYLAFNGRTFIFRDTSGVDFEDLEDGDGIYVYGADRNIYDIRSSTVVWLDDFTLIARGTGGYTSGGYTLFIDSIYGIGHIVTNTFRDSTNSFLARGVQAGDYLYVRGTWAAAGVQPTNGDRSTATGGPGNTVDRYLPIISVAAGALTISTALQDEIFKSGSTASSNGITVSGSVTLTLNPSSSVTFTSSPTIQQGDFISLWESVGFANQEWEVLTVNGARSITLIATATATASSGSYTTRWVVRKGPTNGGRRQTEWPLSNCVDPHEWAVIRVKAGIDPATYPWLVPGATSLVYTARSQMSLADVLGSISLTISDVPAGITFPNRAGRTIDVSATDEVHVGGCTDVYIHEPSPAAKSVTYSELHDQEPLVIGDDLACIADSDVVSSATAASTTIPPYAVVVIVDGVNKGVYRILGPGGVSGSFRVDQTFASSFSAVSYYITADAVLSLDDPRQPRTEGTALVSYFQSFSVEDASGDFSGVEVGDTLRVTDGENEGVYPISAVPSAVKLTLSKAMGVNAVDQSYEVYKALTPITRPFRRVTKVETLTASGAPSGLTIPPANPIDIRSNSFSNIGRGELLSGSDAAVYGPYSIWVPGTDVVSNTRFMLNVTPGCTLKIKSGRNAGTYEILYAFGSLLFLNVLRPLQETLLSPLVQIVHDGASGAYVQGAVVTFSAVTFGTVESYSSTTKTLTVQVSTTAPVVGSSITSSAITRNIVSYVADIDYEIGPPSIGTARAYFLEPTMFEVRCENSRDDDTAVFSTSDSKTFMPDYHINYEYMRVVDTERTRWIRETIQVVPYTALVGAIHFQVKKNLLINAVTAGVILYEFQETATTGTLWITNVSAHGTVGQAITSSGTGNATCGIISVATDCLADAEADFVSEGVEVGDKVLPLTYPLLGTKDLTSGANVGGLTLTLSIGGRASQTMTFSGTNPIPLSQVITPYGIIQQIEQAFEGLTVVAHTDVFGLIEVEIHSEEIVVVVGGTAAAGGGGGLLGLTPNQTNESANSDLGYEMSVAAVSSKNLLLLTKHTVGGATPTLTAEEGIKYALEHRGVQRISAKEMAQNVDANGLYYFDIELRAIEPGDGGNLADSTELTVAGHRSLGYRLESTNEALTFSAVEEVDFYSTPVIQDPEVDDGPDSYVTVMSDGIRVSYENDSVVGYAQSTLLRDVVRVVCNNPVAKVMQPAFFRTALNYSGGEKAVVVSQDVTNLVTATQPENELQVSQMYDLLSKRGATRVTGPVELLAVRHNVDRSLSTVRSKDRLSTGRTAKLIPDAAGIKVTRS